MRYNISMNTLNFPNYISATEYLAKIMQAVEENPDVEHVIIVPEVYTLEFEKLIYGQGKGSFSIQVKSFNRLFSAYCDTGDVISKSGAVLLIKKITYDISESLTCFKNSYAKSGFALKMYETISRLRDQKIDPESMRAESLKKNKINDVKLIYQEYVNRTKDKYVDTAGKKLKLAEYFNGLTEKQNKYYYVLNFDVLTPATLEVLGAIDKKSNGVMLLSAEPAPTLSKAKTLTVYKARDMIDQLKTVARNVSQDLYSGMSADGIIIAGEQLNYDTIKRVLSDFDVPFYMSKKEALGSHPLASFLIGTLQCVRKGMKREDVIALAKNPAVEASKQERDAFCRYVYENLVDYKGFVSEFTRESEYVKKAEKVRQRLAKLFNKAGALRSSVSVKTFTENCKTVLENAFIPSVQVGLDFDKVKTTLAESLDFICGVYGDDTMSGDFLIDSLRDLLASTEFSVVQKTSGVVKVGTLNDFRGQSFKKIYLLSFNDGILPKTEEDVALLTDGDIAEMESFGLEFEGRISVLNERYRDELWQLLQNECDVFASYVCEENGKKSYDLQILHDQFGKPREYSLHTYISTLNTCEDAEAFARLVATRANGKEIAGVIDSEKLSASLIASTGGAVDDGYSFVRKTDETASPLSMTSVSAIQSYYSCPFSYFCKYVLGLSKNEDGKVTPLDVGNIMHATVSEFLMLEEKEPIKEKVTEIINRYLEQEPKASLEANFSVVERLKSEAVKVCGVAYDQLKKGKYKVKACEASFGYEDSSLNTLTFVGKGGEVKLKGSIDRVDEWEGRARVIDYKTGGGGVFAYSDLYYATKLQLPLYEQVVIKNGYKAGGFFYFPFVSSWSDDESASMLNGVFESSDENIGAMEIGSLSSGATIFDMPIDKKTGLANKKNGLEENEIQKVCDYAIRMVQNAINAIEQGKFEPSPIKTARSDVCAYCEFSGICKKDDETPIRSRYVSDKVAKNYLIKQEAKNGK
ncbi:MAG: PD-(D/E)XK nuclease family protein [Clostridia bacterium]|nr:PD-(D/E)XK nuclease family protein [Clostridia bacterium]